MSGLNVWEGGRYGLFDQNGNLLPAASIFEQFIPPTLAGDYNGDGRVDAADFVVWRENNGTLDGYDTWRTNFGSALNGIEPAASASAGIPEPAAITVTLIGLMLLLNARSIEIARKPQIATFRNYIIFFRKFIWPVLHPAITVNVGAFECHVGDGAN